MSMIIDFGYFWIKEHNEQLENRTRMRTRGVEPQRAAALYDRFRKVE
jgi:hypothetical protein